MARSLLSSEIPENLEDDEIQDILKILQKQKEEIEISKDTGDGGWRCVCHKIQSCILAAVKKSNVRGL